MRTRTTVLSCLALLTASVAYADIQIRVFYDNASPVDLTPVDPGDPINVTVTDHTTKVWIRADDPDDENIGFVMIYGAMTNADHDLQILISSESGFADGNPTLERPYGGRDWEGLAFASSATRDTARLSATLYRDLTGPVSVGAIHRLHTLRDLAYYVTVTNPDLWNSLDVLAVGAIVVWRDVTSAASVDIEEGSAQFVFVGSLTYAPNTELAGEILALNGLIGTIEVNGDIAAPITCKHGISRIEACAVNADITANYDNESNVADLRDGYIGDMVVTGFTDEAEGVVTGVIRANDGGSVDDNFPPMPVGEFTITGEVTGRFDFKATLYATLRVENIADRTDSTYGIEVGGNVFGDILVKDRLSSLRVHGYVSPAYDTTQLRIYAGESIGLIQITSYLGHPDCEALVHLASPVIGELFCAGISGVVDGQPDDEYVGEFEPGPTEIGKIFVRAEPYPAAGNFQYGKVWAMGEGHFQFDGSMYGQIEYADIVPAENRSLVIGLNLGGNNGCGVENSISPALIYQEEGHPGQVVVNAGNTTGAWSVGARWVNSEEETLFQLSPTPTAQPNQAPYYERLSADLGGGAIGLVPYHLHREDCTPAHAPSGSCDFTFASKTWPSSHGGEERETIVLIHRGTVFDGEDGPGPDDPATNPLVIERKSILLCFPTPCPGEDPTWTDRSDLYDVYVPPGLSREVWVSLKLDEGEPQAISVTHQYRISLRAMGETTQLRSGMTFLDDENAPGIGGYPYEFNPMCESLMGPPPEE